MGILNPGEGEEYYLGGEALVPQEALKAAGSKGSEGEKNPNSHETRQDLRLFGIENTSHETGNNIGTLFNKK